MDFQKNVGQNKEERGMAQKYLYNTVTNSSEYLFPDARYAEEDGRLGFFQCGDKRSLIVTVQSNL
jgi:hypothetical protein